MNINGYVGLWFIQCVKYVYAMKNKNERLKKRVRAMKNRNERLDKRDRALKGKG
jgi:chaperonin cofactor prefoldin